jgi:Na+/H+ antiporter NhaD/arsenite permease-like protein
VNTTANIDAGSIIATVGGASFAGFLQIITFITFLGLLALLAFFLIMHKNRKDTKAKRDFIEADHEKRLGNLESEHKSLGKEIFDRLNPMAESIARIEGYIQAQKSGAGRK